MSQCAPKRMPLKHECRPQRTLPSAQCYTTKVHLGLPGTQWAMPQPARFISARRGQKPTAASSAEPASELSLSSCCDSEEVPSVFSCFAWSDLECLYCLHELPEPELAPEPWPPEPGERELSEPEPVRLPEVRYDCVREPHVETLEPGGLCFRTEVENGSMTTGQPQIVCSRPALKIFGNELADCMTTKPRLPGLIRGSAW